jgi:hypothetical protein
MTLRDKGQTQPELKHYRFTELYKSALGLVDFVASLQSEQLREFWLPCEYRRGNATSAAFVF